MEGNREGEHVEDPLLKAGRIDNRLSPGVGPKAVYNHGRTGRQGSSNLHNGKVDTREVYRGVSSGSHLGQPGPPDDALALQPILVRSLVGESHEGHDIMSGY